MWKMTLKQRRRHSELVARFDQLKKSPYLVLPEGYEMGKDPEEDEKYKSAIEAMNAVVQEMHELILHCLGEIALDSGS